MQFGKTCTRKFLKDAQIALVLRTRAILNAFQKLTRACFSQIALETILLPILIIDINISGLPAQLQKALSKMAEV